MQKFLAYANIWWVDYTDLRSNHKTRLVKIYAETDDRDGYVHKPVCMLVYPMYCGGEIESPMHAAKYVSMIPFHHYNTPSEKKVEMWSSM
jgi:hypothetical protein